MGNVSSYEQPFLCPSDSPSDSPSSGGASGCGDPRSPSAEFNRTPLKLQQIPSDPRSPSRGLVRTPITTSGENQEEAGKKKLFNRDRLAVIEEGSVSP